MTEIQIVPSDAALCAEVKGIDLSRPFSEDVVARVRDAFFEHCVLLFRDQSISEEDQVRFSRYFGNPVAHVREQAERTVKEIFVISNVTEDGKPVGALGNQEITFHSDLSYMPKPGSISILYSIEVPDVGGDTTWANCYTAYEALDADLKGRIAGLRAVHLHPREQQNPARPASHPLMRTHPETKRKVLYVNPYFTRYIEGMGEAESRELLDTLLAHVIQPRFAWTHKWRAGDLLMWDNRCTLHRRESFDNSKRRIMKRTQMFGVEPV